jgi:hypothetical protein
MRVPFAPDAHRRICIRKSPEPAARAFEDGTARPEIGTGYGKTTVASEGGHCATDNDLDRTVEIDQRARLATPLPL